MRNYDYEGYDQNGKKVMLNETNSVFSGHDLAGVDENGDEVYGDYRRSFTGREWIEYSKAAPPEPNPGGESLMFFFFLILFGGLAVAVPVIIWWALIREGIPAVTVLAILGVGLAGFLCLRNPAETFRQNFRKARRITAAAFFAPATLFSFFLPVIPDMAAPFSVESFLGIALISVLIGIGPGVFIALLCKVMPSFRSMKKRPAARRYHAGRALPGNIGRQSAADEWEAW